MNNTDKEYQRLLSLILDRGRIKKNRTGTDTIGVFGAQARYDLAEGFPLLTTKKMAINAIIHELLWFIRGDTNIKYLVDNGCNIWNGDAYRNFLAKSQEANAFFLTKEQYIEKIKHEPGFSDRWGDLGQGTYGQMWRAFPYWDCNGIDPQVDYVDQLKKVIDTLKTNPDSRRIIVSAWHPYWVDHCVLPPCHCLFHFNTEELSNQERLFIGKWEDLKKVYSDEAELGQALDNAGVPKRRLNCLLYQRSCDTFLGVPFNIASYGLLTSMIAHVVGMVPGEFVHTYGDLHLYQNHIEQAKLQLTREPMKLPNLWLNPEVKDLFAFKFEDIRIENYVSHPSIKGEVSTG